MTSPNPRDEAGEQLYRFLDLGEVIEAGDECPSDNCERWEPVNRWAIGSPRSTIFKIIRRPAAKPPSRVDAVARREAAMLVMEMAEDRDPDNVAEMFRIYENAPHDCEERTGVRKPYGCGRCDVERAYAAADRIRSALSPAATSGSEAGPSCTYCGDTGTITDRVDGEVTCPECGYAQPASSPAGGDVRDGALGWNSPEEWEIEQRAFHAAGRDDVPKDVQELVAILWKQYCIAAEPSAALSPSTSAAEPVAWIDASALPLPKDTLNTSHMTVVYASRSDGFGGRRIPLYATPPAPAAVDGQRVKP